MTSLSFFNHFFQNLIFHVHDEVHIDRYHEHKKEIIRLLSLHEFKINHNFASWQFSATCCPEDAVEAHWIRIWDFQYLSVSAHFLHKIIRFKREAENAFKDFLVSTNLELYPTTLNNFVNQWQKCIDVQGSYFDRLKQFKFIHLGIITFEKKLDIIFKMI